MMLELMGMIFLGLIFLGLLGPVLSISVWGIRSIIKIIVIVAVVKFAAGFFDGVRGKTKDHR